MGVPPPHYSTVLILRRPRSGRLEGWPSAPLSLRAMVRDASLRDAPHHEVRSYAGTSASTRSGLPEPFSILSGVVISKVPVGGSLSRLVRLASPNLFAPCIR